MNVSTDGFQVAEASSLFLIGLVSVSNIIMMIIIIQSVSTNLRFVHELRIHKNTATDFCGEVTRNMLPTPSVLGIVLTALGKG